MAPLMGPAGDAAVEAALTRAAAFRAALTAPGGSP
jgi:hypothetical protein